MAVKKTNFRWAIVALLFFATTVNYFDRFLMGILAPLLETEIGWTELQYGYIVSSFQFAYAIGTLLAGYVIDRVGTRWGFALAVGLWSIASMLHAAARSWIGFVLNESGTEGYNIAFAVALCGYLIGIAIIHLLVPKMKPLTKL